MKRRVLTSLLALSLLGGIPISANAEWKQNNTGWWYSEGNSYAMGWSHIYGEWYYFDSNGYMKTGWIHDNDGKWYYLDETGKMLSNTTTSDGYVLKADGSWDSTVSTVNNNQANKLKKVSQKPSDEKLKQAEKNSWFEYNGNKYFKIEDNKYATGWLAIDLGIYYFDENGVSQTEPFILDGIEYYPKIIGMPEKFQIIDGAPYINTAIATGKFKNGYDPIKFKAPDDPTIEIYDYESQLKSIGSKLNIVKDINGQVLNEKVKYDEETNTITIRKGRDFSIACFEFHSPTEKYQVPAFTAYFKSEDSSIVETDVQIGFLDGYINGVIPRIITKKVGKSKVTFNANNIKQTFNIIVTE